jgi:nitroimidazol reductase NimA-like FMN-containing flavoprotein (pyridoxamine 5'-phosphate oxidase superfamily)
MPGYGIPETRDGLLSWKWAVERLQAARTYWVATSRPDAKPHVMPVWGVWFKDAFFFSTGKESRKARNLALNPNCSVAIEIASARRAKKDFIGDSIIVEGLAELVDDARVRKTFCRIYEEKYAWDMKDFAEPMYRVQPATVFGFTEGFNRTATRWIF